MARIRHLYLGRLPLLALLILLIRAAAQCDDKESAMYRCLYSVNLVAATECEACVSEAIPTTVHYCHELNPACDIIPDCPCAPCGNEILDYVSCGLHNVTGCTLNCSTAVLRLASEEGTLCEGWGCSSDGSVACQAEREQYSECLNDDDRLVTCEQCLALVVPLSVTGAGCDVYRTTLCTSLGTYCRDSCALSCSDQLETYLQCSVSNKLNETCDMSCGWNETLARSQRSSVNTTCGEYATSLKTCLLTYELGSEIVDTCPTCVLDAFGSDVDSSSCSDLEGGVCAALGACDCGACQGRPVSDYFDCVASSIPASCSDATCNLGGDDDNAATTAPATVCSDQWVGIRQCLLINEIGTDLAQTCPTCVSNAFPVGSDLNTVSCDALETLVCPNLAGCDCGVCDSNVASYFDCVAESTTPSCDGLTYDGTCTGGDGGSGSRAPASAPSAGGPTPSAGGPTAPAPVPSTPAPQAPSPTGPTSVAAPSRFPTPPVVAPPPSPVASRPSPSPPPVAPECATQNSLMRNCLNNRLTLSQSGCPACVRAVDAALGSSIADCQSIRSALCAIVGGSSGDAQNATCDCGACTDLVRDYYDCAVERATGSGNCSTDCDNEGGGGVGGNVGTSGGGVAGSRWHRWGSVAVAAMALLAAPY